MVYVFRNTRIVETGISAGDLDEGKIVTFNEAGSPVQFYLAKQDYEIGLNGPGRVLFVRKECYGSMAWNSANVNAWASTTLLAWLNGDYKSLLDADVQEAIGTTAYYYTPGNGNYAVTTREDAVFQLSAAEFGKSNAQVNVEGSVLPTADMLEIAYFNGAPAYQSTRSPNSTNPNYYCVLKSTGVLSVNVLATTSYFSRPCFTLPASFKFQESEVVA